MNIAWCLLTYEMDTQIQIQILDEAFIFSLCANALWEQH